MAVTIIELQETRGLSETAGKVTASRRFVVFDDSSPLATPSDVRANFGTAPLPTIGELFPGETAIYAISYDIKHIANSRNQWEVEFRYENTEPGDKQPNEEGYVEYSLDYQAEFREFWRAKPNLTIPQFGTPTQTDIGGTPIDAAGIPRSVQVKMSTVQITETVLGSTISDRTEVIRLLRGRRNNTIFLGAPIGQVLYIGASARRISIDKFQITHRFAQDEYSHLIQTALRNPEGEVITQNVNGAWRAKDVLFIQPFPDFGDFNALSENF